MARNSGLGTGSTKRGAVDGKGPKEGKISEARERGRKSKASSPKAGEKNSSKLSQGNSAAKQDKAPGKRGASSRHHATSGIRQSAGSKLVSIFSSPLVRNVVAAGLASAAATLLYRKSEGLEGDKESHGTPGPALNEFRSSGLQQGTGRKTRREAEGAVRSLPKASDAIDGKVAGASVAKKASPTVKKAGAAVAAASDVGTGSNRSGNTASGLTGTVQVPQATTRKRKLRSDAGGKRAIRAARPPLAEGRVSDFQPATGSEVSIIALGGAATLDAADGLRSPETSIGEADAPSNAETES